MNRGCCQRIADRVVQRGENGKVFRIDNHSDRLIEVCQVDGCRLTGAKKKCDFMFRVRELDLTILVELKGTDHCCALEQLVESAEQLGFATIAGEKRSFIVCASAPKANTRYQRKLAALSGRFKAQGLKLPVRKNNKHVETIY